LARRACAAGKAKVEKNISLLAYPLLASSFHQAKEIRCGKIVVNNIQS
jgi:hypothetical protein